MSTSQSIQNILPWISDIFGKSEESDKTFATKRGIALNSVKWQKLCDTMKLMAAFVPELSNAVKCEDTHNNEIGKFTCSECSPFPGEKEEV